MPIPLEAFVPFVVMAVSLYAGATAFDYTFRYFNHGKVYLQY
jgi:hypothetical protein